MPSSMLLENDLFSKNQVSDPSSLSCPGNHLKVGVL